MLYISMMSFGKGRLQPGDEIHVIAHPVSHAIGIDGMCGTRRIVPPVLLRMHRCRGVLDQDPVCRIPLYVVQVDFGLCVGDLYALPVTGADRAFPDGHSRVLAVDTDLATVQQTRCHMDRIGAARGDGDTAMTNGVREHVEKCRIIIDPDRVVRDAVRLNSLGVDAIPADDPGRQHGGITHQLISYDIGNGSVTVYRLAEIPGDVIVEYVCVGAQGTLDAPRRIVDDHVPRDQRGGCLAQDACALVVPERIARYHRR